MTQRYHPYDPSDPKPATMYPADEGAYVKWEDFVEMKSERDKANLRWYQEHMKIWKEVVSSDVYQDLKFGKFRDILNLLADGEISVGKAAEAITERAGGIEPALPEIDLAQWENDDRSWKERYDTERSVAETFTNRNIYLETHVIDLRTCIRELLRGGEHEGECTNDYDGDSGGPCFKHVEASNQIEAAARKLLEEKEHA